MEKQVLSIERMQHLQELGLDTSKASMCWRRMTRDFRGEEKIGRWSLVINQPIIVSNFETYEEVTAFTLQDILEILPSCIKEDFGDCYYLIIEQLSNDKEKDWNIRYSLHDYSICKVQFASLKLLNSAYKMLRWYIENNYI